MHALQLLCAFVCQRKCAHMSVCVCVCVCMRTLHIYMYISEMYTFLYKFIYIYFLSLFPHMGWLRFAGSLKSQISFAKKQHKRDYILQKRPIISRSLLIVAINLLPVSFSTYIRTHIFAYIFDGYMSLLTWNFMHTSGTEWRTRIECLKL